MKLKVERLTPTAKLPVKHSDGDMGFEYLGFELDEDYYRMANERLEAHKAQLSLF